MNSTKHEKRIEIIKRLIDLKDCWSIDSKEECNGDYNNLDVECTLCQKKLILNNFK